MNNRNKHTKKTSYRVIRSSKKIAVLLSFSLFLFLPNILKAQVISNNAVISVSSGIVVQGDTLENNTSSYIINNGTIGLRGHYINIGASSGNGIYNIAGNWINTGIFSSGNSTVHFMGSNNQSITSSGGEKFNNLSINNSGASSVTNRIILWDNVNISGTLTISQGNVETGANKLFLSNQLPASLSYTSVTGSRIIGQFERGIMNTGNYLFPIGSDSYYNPLNLNLNNASVAGSVLSEFIVADPGSSGLPLPDADVEVYQAYDDGYWSLSSNGFSSNDFNLSMDGAGFTPAVQDITRIIKRPAGGDWLFDGVHSDAGGSVTYRNNLTGGISPVANHFGFGQSRPRIWKHPADTAVCETTIAMFEVTTTGRGPLEYQWQENQGSGWQDISDAGIYFGTTTAYLRLYTTTLAMDGYQYRVIITDYHGNYTVSDPATLTVNPIPVATATPDRDTLCNNETTHIVLSSNVSGTTFDLEVFYSGNINGASSSWDGTTIVQQLTNPTDVVDSVIYRITPTGPVSTYCEGDAEIVVILVNPTPRVIPVVAEDRICFGEATDVQITTPTVMSHGILKFDYTVSLSGGAGDVVGDENPQNDLDPGHVISFNYDNNSDTVQSVFYHILPRTEGTGCASGPINTAEVKIHPLPLLDIIVTNPLTCNSNFDLALRAIVPTGTEPLTIDWTGPFDFTAHNETDVSGLRGGIYYVVVSDMLGCVTIDDIEHTKAPPTTVFYSPPKPPDYSYNTSCYGSSDADLLIQVEGEDYPYHFWVIYNGTDTVLSNGLLADNTMVTVPDNKSGSYDLHLLDANGCYYYLNTFIQSPNPISATYELSDYAGFNISCRGYNDGEIIITDTTGGNGDYEFLWTTDDGLITGDNTLDHISNLPVGSYYVQITDKLNCMTIDTIKLIEPDGITLQSYELSLSPDGNYNISCNGFNDGSIKLNFTGGSGAYSYEWTGPQGQGFEDNEEEQNTLIAGSYRIVVSDINHCTDTITFALSEPDSLEVQIDPSLTIDDAYNISCNGGFGSIDITVSGGSPSGYNYVWSTESGSGLEINAEDQSGLTVGKYFVTITDINDCVLIDSVQLTEPDPLVVNHSSTDITCEAAGMDNGSITLQVSGGVEQYVYLWSTGSTDKDIYGLTEGRYYVAITDIYGCVIEDSVDISMPLPLEYSKSVSDYNAYGISCYNQTDGWITMNMISGEEPYQYSWEGPEGFSSTEISLSGLGAGEYIITVTDSKLCSITDTTILTQPDQIGITLDLSSSDFGGYNVNCYGDSTASIDVIPENFVGDVDYYWTDGTATSSRSNLSAGVYGILIVDDNACTVDSIITLTEPDSIIINATIIQPFCLDKPDGEISLNVEGGFVLSDYFYQWWDNSSLDYVDNIAAGEYWIIVTDNNGCSTRDTIIVTSEQESCLTIPNAISPNGDGINDVWNIELIELYPEAEIKIFNRWGILIWASEKGYPQPWDGSSKGRSLPIDSYHYIINLHNGTKLIIGPVTIVDKRIP